MSVITAQAERASLHMDELKAILPRHWEELALDRDKVPLDPDYAAYAALDLAGKLVFVTLRKDGRLIGYFVGVCAPHLHYRTCLTLTMDIFYLDPEHRDGSPGAALRLFREVEREARRRGVQRWIVGSKAHKDAGRLFERLKFAKIETFYSKWLGD